VGAKEALYIENDLISLALPCLGRIKGQRIRVIMAKEVPRDFQSTRPNHM
jgi:hypothetical protein